MSALAVGAPVAAWLWPVDHSIIGALRRFLRWFSPLDSPGNERLRRRQLHVLTYRLRKALSSILGN